MSASRHATPSDLAPSVVKRNQRTPYRLGHDGRGRVWATAVLRNGLGRYQEAFAAASEALRQDPTGLSFSPMATVELSDASSRVGQGAVMRPALERLAAGT